ASDGEEAGKPAHHPAHDSDAPAARRGGPEHDPGVAGPCVVDDDQRVRRGGHAGESKGAGELRSGRGRRAKALARGQGADGVLALVVTLQVMWRSCWSPPVFAGDRQTMHTNAT